MRDNFKDHRSAVVSNVDLYDEIAEAIQKDLIININGEFYFFRNPEEVYWVIEEAVYMRDYMPDSCGTIVGVRYDKVGM